MDATTVSKIIKEITGKAPDKQQIIGILTEGKLNNSYEAAYTAMENLCLRALAEAGVFEILSQW
jgi:hypothetical protein